MRPAHLSCPYSRGDTSNSLTSPVPLREPPFQKCTKWIQLIMARNQSFCQWGEETCRQVFIQDSMERFPKTSRHLCIFFTFGNRSRKVDGGERCVQVPRINCRRNFFSVQGTLQPLETSATRLSLPRAPGIWLPKKVRWRETGPMENPS